MTAQIRGVVTRDQAGLIPPKRRPSTNIDPAQGGSCGHWGGTRQGIGSHERCLVIWRSWQRFHMAPGGLGARDGGNDIAYNFGYCNHGFIFVGRGWGVRSGANGSTEGNGRYYAFVWIGGVGDGEPTEEAFDALDWLIREGRRRGAGRRVRPHSDFSGTTCPGSVLRSRLALRDRRDIPLPAPPSTRPPVKLPPGSARAIIIARRGSTFHLRRELAGGAADSSFRYGREDDLPVTGDWSGQGHDAIGVVRDGRWLLRNSMTGGDADLDIPYGRPGDVPLVGDWDGSGRSGLGVRRGSTFHLKYDVSPGPADVSFKFGRDDDVPLVGDWNGDGRDTVGVFREGAVHLVNDLRGGASDVNFRYGRPGDVPLVGDWDGSGRDYVGIHRGSWFYLRADHEGGNAQFQFEYGRDGDEAVVVRKP